MIHSLNEHAAVDLYRRGTCCLLLHLSVTLPSSHITSCHLLSLSSPPDPPDPPNTTMHRPSPPPSRDPTVTLPPLSIWTYRVAKRHPNNPICFIFVKAWNDTVLVQSLFPRSDTDKIIVISFHFLGSHFDLTTSTFLLF